MTADEFRAQLPGLPNIWGYDVTVTSEMLDAQGDVTVDAGQAEQWIYYISMAKWRDQEILMPYTNTEDIVAGTLPAKITIERIQEHSPPLRGSFKIFLDGVPLTIDGTDSGDQNFPIQTASAIQTPMQFHYSALELTASLTMSTDLDE